DGGDRITTTLAVTVTAGTMRWPLVNCAYLSWDTSQKEMCFTTTVNPSLLYLPLIMRNFTPKPDLQVTSLGVDPVSPTAGDPVTVTVEVENVGEKATESFWVDLYDDPSPPPTDANQLWSDVCSGPLEDCYGIAWYVDSGLDPGESVVLTSVGGYETEQSHWLGYFADSGSHDLYAFADSWNATVWFGGVLEHNEGVDNRAGPVTVNVGAGGGALGTSEDEEVSIPLRPNHP
ncbi:MAG: CARDB domain-containing protein, partial [Anaerolineae bacterium]